MPVQSLRIVSGYRAAYLEPEQRRQAWDDLCETVAKEPWLTIMQAILYERFYVDDSLKGLAPSDFLLHGLNSGELFAHFNGSDLIGISILREIVTGRDAVWEAWAHPLYRGRRHLYTAAKHVIQYAFKPFDQGGLGLRKLKAQVCISNKPAVRATANLGFYHLGTSPADGLYSGQYANMLILELPNPAVFNLPRITDGQEAERPADTADAGSHSAARVLTDAGPADDRPAGDETRTGNPPVKRNRRVRDADGQEGQTTGSKRTPRDAATKLKSKRPRRGS